MDLKFKEWRFESNLFQSQLSTWKCSSLLNPSLFLLPEFKWTWKPLSAIKRGLIWLVSDLTTLYFYPSSLHPQSLTAEEILRFIITWGHDPQTRNWRGLRVYLLHEMKSWLSTTWICVVPDPLWLPDSVSEWNRSWWMWLPQRFKGGEKIALSMSVSVHLFPANDDVQVGCSAQGSTKTGQEEQIICDIME